MARLRKPAALEPSVTLQHPDQTRPRRSSPRKTVREISYVVSSDDEENVPLKLKLSKHSIGEPSSIFLDDTFYTSKSTTSPSVLALTPRRQRTLRPIESNSRLPLKLNMESFGSPEKRPASERKLRLERGGSPEIARDIDRKRNLMYSRSLARSIAGKGRKKTSAKNDFSSSIALTETERGRRQPIKGGIVIQEFGLEPEHATSILCGDHAGDAQEAQQQQLETKEDAYRTSDEQHTSSDDQESDDEDVVLPVRAGQRRQQRCIDSSSESEYGEEMTGDSDDDDDDDDENRQDEATEEPQPLLSMRPPHRKGHSTISDWAQEIVDLAHSPEAPDSHVLPEPARARSSSFAASRPATSSSESVQPFLSYSPTPTKKRSPSKVPPETRPMTPPPAILSPAKLVSPSKKKPHISAAPGLRPSLDAFWNSEVVNDWNDRHSPVKKIVSPKKQQWRNDVTEIMYGSGLEDASSSDEACTSPVLVPKKATARSQSPKKSQPSKVDPAVKVVRAQRRDFADRREDIATSFLAELDTTICSGHITKLSEATGGIKLTWSNTLKTTAGRANWRREVLRVKVSSDPPTYKSEIRHHCSIELASKVIDDSSRLYNVLAHEFCHLLTFMVSEVRNNPHGAEFKSWGRKVSAAFADKGVEVTTKHSYAIEYKFVWECVACGYEFKRHSRSVDTTRHSCGKCKGKLVQTKPVPRGAPAGKGGEGAKRSGYQIFVKENFKRVKEEMAAKGLDAQMGKVMEVVARQYREDRDAKSISEKATVEDLDLVLQQLNL